LGLSEVSSFKHTDEAKRSKDYVDPRFSIAEEKARDILIRKAGEWHSIVDAYWLLRRMEDEIGIPVTYDIVEKAYMGALQVLATDKPVKNITYLRMSNAKDLSSIESSNS
jgi:hypothetical protein